MPDGVAPFALDASREEFISLLKAREDPERTTVLGHLPGGLGK